MTRGGGGGTPFNGLCGEASPERGTVFQASGQEGVVSLVEVYERVRKSVISACKRAKSRGIKLAQGPSFTLRFSFLAPGIQRKTTIETLWKEPRHERGKWKKLLEKNLVDFEPVPLDKNMVNTLLRGKTLQTKVKRVSLFELSSFNLVFLMYLLVLRSVVL